MRHELNRFHKDRSGCEEIFMTKMTNFETRKFFVYQTKPKRCKIVM